MVVATRAGDHFADELERRLGALRIATKYPRIATRYFESSGRQAEVIEVKGSVELAPISGLAEGIVDLHRQRAHAAREPPRGAGGDRGLHRAAGREPRVAQAAPGGDRRRSCGGSASGSMHARHFTLESRDRGDVDALAEAMRGLVEPPGAVTAAVAEILERGPRATATARCTSSPCAGTARRRRRTSAFRRSRSPPRRRRSTATCGSGSNAAIANVERLAQAELSADLTVDMPQGQSVTIRELPVRRAGAYVPGGRAAYPVLRRDVLRAGPRRRRRGGRGRHAAGPRRTANPVILAACALCGVEEVHLMGGAQAIAALAYGTATRGAGRRDRGTGQLLRAGGQAPGRRTWSGSTASPGPASCS